MEFSARVGMLWWCILSHKVMEITFCTPPNWVRIDFSSMGHFNKKTIVDVHLSFHKFISVDIRSFTANCNLLARVRILLLDPKYYGMRSVVVLDWRSGPSAEHGWPSARRQFPCVVHPSLRSLRIHHLLKESKEYLLGVAWGTFSIIHLVPGTVPGTICMYP